MTGYVRTARGKRRPGVSPFALQLLRRLETWQLTAGCYATADDIVAAGGRRDWLSLQGLMGRGLVNVTEDKRLRLTSEGWRYLKAYRA